MDLFKWTNDYSVNNDVLDREHQNLFSIFNKLLSAFMNRETHERLGEILSELHEYTKYHFKHEEELLAQKKLSLSKEHKKAHEEFVAKIAVFDENHAKGMPVVQYEMMNFLRSWLNNHIKGTDKEYALYIKN